MYYAPSGQWHEIDGIVDNRMRRTATRTFGGASAYADRVTSPR